MCDRAPPFVIKLRVLLDNPRYHHAISWSESGTVVLVNKAAFGSTVLGTVFKSSKFKSFVRQMNLHGFRQTARPSNANVQGFQCKSFVKVDEDGVLQACMERKASKSIGVQDDSCGESEPELAEEHLLNGGDLHIPSELFMHHHSCALRQAVQLVCGYNTKELPHHKNGSHFTTGEPTANQQFEEPWLQ